MTYDDAPELYNLARRHGLQTALVPMKNTHHAEMTELLIGHNLGWARSSAAERESETLEKESRVC